MSTLERALALLLRLARNWPLLALVALGMWAARGGLAPAAAFQVGGELPELSAELADGSRFSLAQARDQVLVLNFWASYCQPCRVEAPLLSAVQAQAKDVRVVGLSVEQYSPAVVAAQAHSIGMHYPVGVADEALLSRFRVQRVPTTYVIGKNRKIVLSRVGVLSERELHDALAAARDAS